MATRTFGSKADGLRKVIKAPPMPRPMTDKRHDFPMILHDHPIALPGKTLPAAVPAGILADGNGLPPSMQRSVHSLY